MKKILFILTISTIFYACPSTPHIDSVCDRYYWHHFDIPVSFDPPDSVLHIGDTITITSQFPNKLWDQDSTDQFIFDSINFYTKCGIAKIDTFNGSQMSNSLLLFDYIIDTIKYKVSKNNITYNIKHNYNNNEYYLKFKVVPKYKGVFFFTFPSSLNTFRDLYDRQNIYAINGECSTIYWAPWLITNNGIGNNKEFLKLSPRKYYNTTAYNDWYRHNHIGGVHLFRVE